MFAFAFVEWRESYLAETMEATGFPQILRNVASATTTRARTPNAFPVPEEDRKFPCGYGNFLSAGTPKMRKKARPRECAGARFEEERNSDYFFSSGFSGA